MAKYLVSKMQNQTYNDVMSELQDYMLDEPNMEKAVKIKDFLNERTEKKEKYDKNIKNIQTTIDNNNKIFIPKEKDSLFWCFYIITNGEVKYETFLHKNDVYAKQIKIDYVEKIRKEKKTVKIYKFDTITNIESNLVNDNIINPKTFLTLCVIENINIIYVNKKTYFELLMNDTDTVFIIYDIKGSKYGFELGNKDKIENIKNTLYRIDKIDKPIKSISAYTLQELIDISNKLAIQTTNVTTNKSKSKKDLYEGIIQYF